MRYVAKWRGVVALLLVFAVSPFSACAQAVCHLTCSRHLSAVPDAGPKSPRHREALSGSAAESAGMHCHGRADSDGAHPGVFRNSGRSCHQDNCVLTEVAAAPAVAQDKGPGAPVQVIRIEPSNFILITTPTLSECHRWCDPRVSFSDFQAASQTLRI